MSEARIKLAAVQAEAASMTVEIEQMETALSQARMDVQEAEASLKRFAELDKHISHWRAAALKKGKDPKKLPDNVKQQLQERKAAEEELTQSNDTFEVLQQEIAEAKAKLEKLRSRPEELAVEVLLAELIEPLAEEFIATSKRQWELRQQLLGFAYTRRGNLHNGENLGHTRLVSEALKGWVPVKPGSEVPGSEQPQFAMEYRWYERVEALIKDSGAEVTIPKPVLPSDFRGLASGYNTPQWADERGEKIIKIAR